MASTNKTSNLQLSQFIATDTPTWLVDYNGDMEKIDAGVGRVEELAETASTQAVGVASGLQATNQTVTTLSGQVANVQNQANTTTASVNGINQRLGNSDISGIGDGTITGAIISMQNNNLSEVHTLDWDNAVNIEVSASADTTVNTSYTPTKNGMYFICAQSPQSAIAQCKVTDTVSNRFLAFFYIPANYFRDSAIVPLNANRQITITLANCASVEYSYFVPFK